MMKYIKNILSVLVVLLIGYFVYKNVDLEELKKINLETIIYLFLLSLNNSVNIIQRTASVSEVINMCTLTALLSLNKK